MRHYLQDVGSTFGIGANGPHDWDEGFEYFYEGDSSRRRLLSFGFALSPWQTAPTTRVYPSIGRFEARRLRSADVEAARADDRLHGDAAATTRSGRRAGWRRSTTTLIRALVHTGQFSDPAAEEHLATVLIQRRDKIARAYLPAVNPIVDPRLSARRRR